jgi:hypothetical protein
MLLSRTPLTLPLEFEMVEAERSHVDPDRTDRLPIVAGRTQPVRVGPKHRLGCPRPRVLRPTW